LEIDDVSKKRELGMQSLVRPDDRDMVIGVVGDSLPLPRPHEGLKLSITYPYLIADELRSSGHRAEVWRIASAGATVTEIAKRFADERPYLGGHPETFCVVHLGVVDCSPRPVPPSIRSLIGRSPRLVRGLITKILHDYRVPLLTHGFSFVNTRPNRFEAEYHDLLSIAGADFGRIYAVNIIPPGDWFESRSPGVGGKISRYNEIIAAVVRDIPRVTLIDIWTAANIDVSIVSSVDGHHLSPVGHRYLANEILRSENLVDPAR
jgi:hypothetical protein